MNEPDNSRLREFEMLERVVHTSGALDCGSGICAKIDQLANDCYRLSKHEVGMFPRQSTMAYLRGLVLADLKRQSEVGDEPLPPPPSHE